MKTQQFMVYGHVQGVGFRFFTWREAQRLGINGWVKNQADGSVSVIAQGNDAQLAEFANWLQTGPKTATVSYIETISLETKIIYNQFQINR